MLYKPTSPTPYAQSIDSETDNINFRCYMIGNNNVGELPRLMISNGNLQYYLMVEFRLMI